MSDLSALTGMLRAALGPEIGVGFADPRALAPPLWPEETPAIRRMVEKRRREFAAGRAAARAAMADLGLPPAAVPMRPDRAPCWPAGLVGSISHCATTALAVAAPQGTTRSLGVDLEEAAPLNPDLWDMVLTAQERDWLATRPAPDRGHAAKRIFSAKEAVYKAQYPLTGRVLSFSAVTIALDNWTFRAIFTEAGAPCSAPIAGHLVCSGPFVVSLARLNGENLSC